MSLSNLTDNHELRTTELPKPDVWDVAVQRAASILGLADRGC